MVYDDFSEFVTHFTKPTQFGSAYQNQISICSSRQLIAANPFGIGRNKSPNTASQQCVCFSEVPLHCLTRIAQRRSRYGIGFKKEFVRSKGAMPIWYVEKDSSQHLSIQKLMSEAQMNPLLGAHAIWNLTPFIDVPGNHPTGSYRFEWEREWRCVGDFAFSELDVAFLVIPEDLHLSACGFFREARDANTGPFYGCPYIDSNWDAVRVAHAVREGWPHN